MRLSSARTSTRSRVLILSSAFVLAVLLASAVSHYWGLTSRVDQLSQEVVRLRQEQAAPSVMLARYRNSICYLLAEYELNSRDGSGPPVHLRTSGTGFVISDGMVATSKHVLEPAFDTSVARQYLRDGATPKRVRMLAFFPKLSAPVPLGEVRYADQDDLAVARFILPAGLERPLPVPLAQSAPHAGDAVVVVGYPLGAAGMVAKSPQQIYERLATREEGAKLASELAALELIRPSATFGHLGDVVGSKLVYDAPTAHGGSGGPVFNVNGDVVGINAAYITGFAGGSLGISSEELKALLITIPR